MKGINEEFVIFEAEDVNDPGWEKIIKILQDNGIRVQYADGNWMNFGWNFIWEIKDEEN